MIMIIYCTIHCILIDSAFVACSYICRSAYIEIPEEDSLEIDNPIDLIVAETWLAQQQIREEESI